MKGTAAEKHKERLKNARDVQMSKKEAQINKLTDEEVVNELKDKALPVYGTRQEKLDRLKKYMGIIPNPVQQQQQQGNNLPPSNNNGGLNQNFNNNNINVNDFNDQQKKQNAFKDPTVEKIQKMEQKREERRAKMEEAKREREEKIMEHQALGKNIDVDFEILIEKNRFKEPLQQNHTPASHLKLCVCVRKRPIFKKEETNGEIDSVSVSNPQIRVLAPKFKVDGITKYVENYDFTFDNSFNENEETQDVYKYSLRPLLDHIMNQGVITCFAYGQTGSGKTFTMKGLQNQYVTDMYKLSTHQNYSSMNLKFFISFFEIYGGRCYDLLNNKNQLVILEDKNGYVQIQNIVEKQAMSAEEMIQLIEYGHNIRTTHATASNDTSSRSHAICQIMLRNDKDKQVGKLVLVDLAGSERAQDCQSNNRQRRMEGAEINKSLLALKECIRAMDTGAAHVPFRASKLTLVLRDSFQSKSDKSKIVMIACISPGSSSSDHTVNTLRYADRLKENKPPVKGGMPRIDAPQLIDEMPSYNINHNNIKSDNQLNDQPSSQKEQLSNRRNHSSNQMDDASPQQQLPPKQNKTPLLPPADKRIAQKIEEERIEKEKKLQQQQQQQAQQQQQHHMKRGQSSNLPSANKQTPTNQQQQQQKNNSQNNLSKNSSDDEGEQIQQVNKGVKDDVRCMKETLKMDKNNKVSNEFFDFHEKVNTILEEQEEIFATHMAAIKEDAKLLTQESELISKVQGTGFIDYDIDLYVKKLETVIKKKLKMYNLLHKKLDTFKKHLQEEEEISSKVKDTFYF
ncbi:kinesin motor catalytic domain protein (macronuclear) [Tetrahymena thermophila SB210]|uniref:Kinesin-like protein n=1 Tax=Tetrahymena thermophila (strain SB210) TaxID=312017 RepID=I7M676_TETTS|nr:kinesin motor catalytic domain protein [Tetrahymena thermophila SB210]EAR84592.2 kinesin motor catalytic domain protein [Tetrahymena thermophila SB210]|eukprot:XP_001032255.2 kinesin motor catalytic domain protein [Tetrahymena thermophila SB210]